MLFRSLGTKPATEARRPAGGDVAAVPEYCDDFLLNRDFSDPAPLVRIGGRARVKGWQAEPLKGPKAPPLVASLDDRAALGLPGKGRVARLGADLPGDRREAAAVPPGASVLLAQEVRNPRAGRYRFTVFAAAMADSVETFREYFAGCFRCRMILFGYADLAKDPRRVREFAALEFEPGLLAPKEASGFTRFELTATLKSQDDGAFQLSRGVGEIGRAHV